MDAVKPHLNFSLITLKIKPLLNKNYRKNLVSN